MSEFLTIKFFVENSLVRLFLATVNICRTFMLLVKAVIVSIMLAIWIVFVLGLLLYPKIHYGFKLLIFMAVVLVVGEFKTKII